MLHYFARVTTLKLRFEAESLSSQSLTDFWFLVGQVAQSVEHRPEKASVGGSIPSLPTIYTQTPRFFGSSRSVVGVYPKFFSNKQLGL